MSQTEAADRPGVREPGALVSVMVSFGIAVLMALYYRFTFYRCFARKGT